MMEAVYMPAGTTAVQQFQNSTDASESATVIQSTSLADNRPPLNTEPSRWIGRENMNSNSSFTLPGGAPKGVSDPVPPSPDSEKSKVQHKRKYFHCDNCDISFKNCKSLDSHKKSFCIKRLKLSPSSTITSSMLMNNPLELTHVNHTNQVTQPYIKELLSAMAIKRLHLEASMKAAIDTQYVISLHKSAQDLARESFKELDDVLNREKASVEEQQISSVAKAQALIKSEAAYKQEKFLASEVEKALCKQKEAIENAVIVAKHEETALISILRSLKEQDDQINLPIPHILHYNLANSTNFNQERSIDSTQTMEQQQIANNIFLR